MRRAVASGGLSAQAAGRPKGVVSGTLLSVELLLRSRGLPQATDAALGAVSGPQGLPACRGDLGGGHAARTYPATRPRMADLFEVDPRTIARWQVFWRDNFPQKPFWKVARGQLALLGELLDLLGRC